MSSYIFMQQAYECLLDQRAPQYVDYESASFSQALAVPQDLLPMTKVQVAANASDSDFQHDGDTCLVLQQLTPPQSPPQFDGYQQQPQEQLLVKEEHKVLPPFANDAAVAVNATAVAATGAYSFNNWMPVSEIARETQLVDDIVNMRAQELQLPINWQQYNDDCESQASSSLGSSSSSSSNNGDISGAGSSIADADEEWLPTSSSSSSSPAHTIAEEPQHSTPSDNGSSSSGPAKKRTRTYGRGTEDRKIRKKEQNKNAATRYRQKKKKEMEHVLTEEQELTQVNDELRRKLGGFKRESRYLRQLIREFYKQPKESDRST
ncbi:vitellogenin-1 isoform X2 [Drosophila grimshawi]|uniref:GH13312 n=1 Tax=Drosophila grimshawi TaxID=7222 RepID=B4JPX6_DROGR|nr:vitellogenin-1 isoform X2 [Drosophila grimshawi]EDV98956.1 GH13312 [Drosophila grimshawi]